MNQQMSYEIVKHFLSWLPVAIFTIVVILGYLGTWFFFKKWMKDEEEKTNNLKTEIQKNIDIINDSIAKVDNSMQKIEKVVTDLRINLSDKYIKSLEDKIDNNTCEIKKHNNKINELELKIFSGKDRRKNIN